jgi:hypothetical protein
MESFYDWLGRRLFPCRQDWEQRKSAKTLVLTIAFSVGLGLALAEVIRMIYYRSK